MSRENMKTRKHKAESTKLRRNYEDENEKNNKTKQAHGGASGQTKLIS